MKRYYITYTGPTKLRKLNANGETLTLGKGIEYETDQDTTRFARTINVYKGREEFILRVEEI